MVGQENRNFAYGRELTNQVLNGVFGCGTPGVQIKEVVLEYYET